MTETLRDPWPELSGRLLGKAHVLPIRVYFEDTDFSGLVYHASYIRWCERGRSDFLRLAGLSHSKLNDKETAAFAVRRLTCDYLKPARIDDILEVFTTLNGITKATVSLSQTISRKEQTLFKLEALCVLLSASGRVLRIPDNLKALYC